MVVNIMIRVAPEQDGQYSSVKIKSEVSNLRWQAFYVVENSILTVTVPDPIPLIPLLTGEMEFWVTPEYISIIQSAIFRLYFFVADQIAHVIQPIWILLAR